MNAMTTKRLKRAQGSGNHASERIGDDPATTSTAPETISPESRISKMNMMSKLASTTVPAITEQMDQRARWEECLATYLRANGELERYEREVYNPAAETNDPMDPIQERFDELVESKNGAAHRLLLQPSPDLRALADKLEIGAEEDYLGDGWRWGKELLTAVCQDARRLASPATDPHMAWLTERDAIMALENSRQIELPEEQSGAIAGRLNELDNLIFDTPAASRDAAVIKLLTVVKALSEGHCMVEDDAAKVIAEVEPLLRQMPLQIEKTASIKTAGTQFIEATAAYHMVRTALAQDDLPEPEIDRLADIETEAAEAVFAIPAPDITAVVEKLRTFLTSYATPHDDILKMILGDMKRLAARSDEVSPAMSSAVLNWKAATKAYCDACEHCKADDEKSSELCRAAADAARALAAVPAHTSADFAIKVYLLALVECGQTGPRPLVHDVDPQDADYEETHLWRGIIADLPEVSSTVRELINTAT